jgi:hypothetical protein
MIKNIIKKVFKKIHSVDELLSEIEKNKFLVGRLLSENLLNKVSKNINDYEFSIFSQWGEDGILDFIIRKLHLKDGVFIEFGVDNYIESNTRFLLFKENWNGLVIDSCEKNVNQIQNSYYYWKYNILAKKFFINKNNINNIIADFLDQQCKKTLDLLSIDIDGNDYWILNNVEFEKFKPKIVVCEYNSLLGNKLSLTIPYKEEFNRENNDPKLKIYYGASIKAFVNLLNKKGYIFLGSNNNANNLFFVAKEFEKIFDHQTVDSGYKKNKFKEFNNEDFNTAQKRLDKKQFFDLEKNQLVNINYLDLND